MIETMFRRAVKQGEVIIRQVLQIEAAALWYAMACGSLVVMHRAPLQHAAQSSASLHEQAQGLAGAPHPATERCAEAPPSLPEVCIVDPDSLALVPCCAGQEA